MFIDFHTHVFPDRISKSAIDKLSTSGGIPAFTDGSLSDTLQKMSDAGVDRMVALSIATNPKQQTNVNSFAISIKSERVIPFGSVHPDSENIVSDIKLLHANGIKGIKIHNEYQNADILDRRYMPAYELCEKLGMVMIFHAGRDIAFKPPVKASPERIRKLSEMFKDLTIVAAHLGGWCAWDQVERELVGTNVYLDTAYISSYIDPQVCKRIIFNHGVDKILFGSDCPWELPSKTISFIESLGLSDEDKQKIYHLNAQKLLGEI